MATVTACVEASASDAELRFEGAAPAMDVLGSQVVEALEVGDVARLERLRLTEDEHNGVVWPELPAAAPGVDFPVDMAWTNIENRNRRSLARLVPAFRDASLAYAGVECRGRVEAFATFRVHTDCWVVFSIEDAPGLLEAQLFKDVLERGGGFKVFRYYEDVPRRRGASGEAPRT